MAQAAGVQIREVRDFQRPRNLSFNVRVRDFDAIRFNEYSPGERTERRSRENNQKESSHLSWTA
jgi:hypothetical protein